MTGPVDRMPFMPAIPGIGVLGAVGSAVSMAANAAGSAAGKGGGGGGGGAGYTFSPEQLDDVIRDWEDLREDLLKDRREADKLANVRGPGSEFASGDFEQAARPSGQKQLEQTERMIAYAEKYIEALKKAKGATVNQNEQAREDAKNASGGLLDA